MERMDISTITAPIHISREALGKVDLNQVFKNVKLKSPRMGVYEKTDAIR